MTIGRGKSNGPDLRLPHSWAAAGKSWESLRIAARSPQAKGRVERLWRTFQDGLVSELRGVKASTVEQAKAMLERFLPEFNQQFAQAARQLRGGLSEAG